MVTGQAQDDEDNSSKTDKTPASTSDGRTLSGHTVTPPDKQDDVIAAKALLSSEGKSENPTTEVETEPPKTKFELDLQRMKEMQSRVELPPDEIETMKKEQVTL